MRDFINLIEAFTTAIIPSYAHDKTKAVDVYTNPSSKEWRAIGGYRDGVRGYIVGDDLIVWSMSACVHREIHDQLKLTRDAIPVYVYGTPRAEADVTVTDASRGTVWWHNPEIVERIERGCAYLNRTFASIEISFYDEAIVGRWDDLDEED